MRYILPIISLFLPLAISAQGESPTKVTRSTMIGIGGMNRLDTYLSPIDYKGTSLRFISSVMREHKCEWDMQYTYEGNIDYTSNPSDNANQIAGSFDFTYALMHRWEMLDGRLKLRAGGMGTLDIGFAYNMRNSGNNPAQGYASLSLGGEGMASYTFPLWHRSFIVSYEARLPLLGIAFSPNYGQSYYEMFSLGNYDHNIVMTSIATPSLRQMVALDVPLTEKAALRLGYLADIRQGKPNNLKQHIYSNSFIIGVTRKL